MQQSVTERKKRERKYRAEGLWRRGRGDHAHHKVSLKRSTPFSGSLAKYDDDDDPDDDDDDCFYTNYKLAMQ